MIDSQTRSGHNRGQLQFLVLSSQIGSEPQYFAADPVHTKNLSEIVDMEERSSPRIAIVLATYNPPEHFFREQLLSIVDQTHSNWLCILTDDSPLPSVRRRVIEIARQIISDPKQLIIVRPSPDLDNLMESHTPLGVFRNFENGLNHVPLDCPLICFCDQDDIWHSEKLATLAGSFESTTIFATHSDLHLIDENNKLLHPSCWISEMRDTSTPNPARLILRNSVTGCALMFRSEVLRFCLPFPTQANTKQPWFYHDVWIALGATVLGSMTLCREPLISYRQHSNNAVGAERKNTKKLTLRRPFEMTQEIIQKSWYAWRGRFELEMAYLQRAKSLQLNPKIKPVFTRKNDFGITAVWYTLISSLRYSRGYLKIGMQIAFGKFCYDLKRLSQNNSNERKF
jgi:glycosyltransferase involved in cell wall biosynthesis